MQVEPIITAAVRTLCVAYHAQNVKLHW